MAKIPTIHEMAREIADEALKELQVNNLPLGVFIARVGKALEKTIERLDKTESMEMTLFCIEILALFNISPDKIQDKKHLKG